MRGSGTAAKQHVEAEGIEPSIGPVQQQQDGHQQLNKLRSRFLVTVSYVIVDRYDCASVEEKSKQDTLHF